MGVTHHSLAAAVSLHSDRRYRTLRVKPEDQSRCLQMKGTTWAELIRIAISTCSPLSLPVPVSFLRDVLCVRARAGTRRRCVSLSPLQTALACGRSSAQAITVLGLRII